MDYGTNTARRRARATILESEGDSSHSQTGCGWQEMGEVSPSFLCGC